MSAISPPVLGPNTGIRAAARRIGAMVLRYFYLLKSSWARVVELAYWPTMQMLIWGLTTEFLMSHSAYFVRAGGVLIAAVLLWDILFRGNLGVSLSFLEEMWSRNLGQLFASPLRPYEWAASLVLISFLRTLIGILPAALLAIPIYHFSIFSLGLPLVVFFGQLLVFGAAIGLTVSALVLRYGLGAESLAWVAVFAIAPLSGIYYPIATLPEWLQPVALALPSAHVFEGMRAILVDGVFEYDRMVYAAGLNVLYLIIGLSIFLHVFGIARRRGMLLQMGE